MITLALPMTDVLLMNIFEKIKYLIELFSKPKGNQEVFPHTLVITEQACLVDYFSRLISTGLNVNYSSTSNNSFENINDGDLAGILAALKFREILFFDRIKLLKNARPAVLSQALNDFEIDLKIDDLYNSRIVKVKLNKFTLVTFTSDYNSLDKSLKDNFAYVISGDDVIKLAESYIFYLFDCHCLICDPEVALAIVDEAKSRELSIDFITNNMIKFFHLQNQQKRNITTDDILKYLTLFRLPEIKTIAHNQSRVISVEVKREVWRRDEGRCISCKSQEKLEYDHIIPFSKGGSNTVRNIQLLCEICNRTKSANL